MKRFLARSTRGSWPSGETASRCGLHRVLKSDEERRIAGFSEGSEGRISLASRKVAEFSSAGHRRCPCPTGRRALAVPGSRRACQDL